MTVQELIEELSNLPNLNTQIWLNNKTGLLQSIKKVELLKIGDVVDGFDKYTINVITVEDK